MGLGVGSEKTLRGGEVHAGFGRQIPKRACVCVHVRMRAHVCLTLNPPSPFWRLHRWQILPLPPSVLCTFHTLGLFRLSLERSPWGHVNKPGEASGRQG